MHNPVVPRSGVNRPGVPLLSHLTPRVSPILSLEETPQARRKGQCSLVLVMRAQVTIEHMLDRMIDIFDRRA